MYALMVPALLALLSSLSHDACAQATTETSRALQALFETDPAAGFEEATRLFEEPKAKGDLEGMMAIIDLVQPRSYDCLYWGALEAMVAQTTPVAGEKGEWRHLGDLLMKQVRSLDGRWFLPALRSEQLEREWRTVEAAGVAYDRGGGRPDGYVSFRERFDAAMGTLAAKREKEAATWASQKMGSYTPLFGDIRQAIADGRDADALAQMRVALRLLVDEPEPRKAYDGVYQLTRWLWVDGAEVLLPGMRVVAERVGEAPGIWLDCAVIEGCDPLWSGRDDAYWRSILYHFGRACASRRASPSNLTFAAKMRGFRQFERIDELADRWLSWAEARDVTTDVNDHVSVGGLQLLHDGTSAARFLRIMAVVEDELGRRPDGTAVLLGGWHMLRRGLSCAKAHEWGAELGAMLIRVALRSPDAATRSQAATVAASVFETVGLPERAERARALSAAFAADDPKLALTCALGLARTRAAEGEWEDVATALGAAMAGAPDGAELLQAATLLLEAHLRLGQADEAARWLSKAKGLLDALPLPAGERANHLVTLAGLCDLAARVAEGGAPQ